MLKKEEWLYKLQTKNHHAYTLLYPQFVHWQKENKSLDKRTVLDDLFPTEERSFSCSHSTSIISLSYVLSSLLLNLSLFEYEFVLKWIQVCGFPLYFPLLCFLFCYRALNALIVVNNYWVYTGKAEIACAKNNK